MAYQQQLEFFEGKIHFTTEKSYLVEATLGGRYFVPKKCIQEMTEPDVDGNITFGVTLWWWNRKHDFEAEDR